MTREIKLALILGFALVLTVGIVIADHFSHAQGASLAQLDGSGQVDSEAAPFRRFISQGADIVRNAMDDSPPVLTRVDQQGRGSESEIDTRPLQEDTPQSLDNQGPRGIEMGKPFHEELSPNERTHTVRSGETLWSIAERYFQDGNKWRQLKQRNKGVVTAAGTVEVGTRLVIPEVGATTPQRTQPRQNTAVTVYTVKAGDTLSGIAADQLGSAQRWREILDLNSDRIDSPTEIYRGLRLKLPSR